MSLQATSVRRGSAQRLRIWSLELTSVSVSLRMIAEEKKYDDRLSELVAAAICIQRTLFCTWTIVRRNVVTVHQRIV